MENSSRNGNQTTPQSYVKCETPLDGYQLVIMSAFDVAISIAAILGNVLILVAFRKVSARVLHPPSKLLFECLAYSDLGVGLVLQPLRIISYNSYENTESCFYGLLASWIVGNILFGVSLLTLTVTGVDRLLALTCTLGLRYRQVVTLRRVRLVIAWCWLCSSVIGMVSLYNFKIAFITSLIGIVLSVVFSTFCYITIFVKLSHHQAQVQDHIHHGQHNNRESQLNVSQYRKTVKSALWVQLTLLICFLPFGVEKTLFAKDGFESSILSYVTASFVSLNSALNPIIYPWKITEVRQAIRATTEDLFQI